LLESRGRRTVRAGEGAVPWGWHQMKTAKDLLVIGTGLVLLTSLLVVVIKLI